MSGLREFLAELHVSVPVTRLAKYKTTLQMVAIGFLLIGPAGDRLMKYYFVDLGLFTYVGLLLLWISALITLYTGYDYFRAGLQASHERRPVKLVYFAWVRERIGRAEEELSVPAERGDRGRPARMAEAARPRIRQCACRAAGDPCCHRPRPRQARMLRSRAPGRSRSSRR